MAPCPGHPDRQRLIHPRSKLATARLWPESSLGRQLGTAQVDVDELVGDRGMLTSARRKQIQRTTADGLAWQSFETLLAHLGTQCLWLCRIKSDPDAPRCAQVTLPTPLQQRAFDLLEANFPVSSKRPVF